MIDLRDLLDALANRAECEHGLNGPCRVCGPSLNGAEALAWRDELRSLIGEDVAEDDGG